MSMLREASYIYKYSKELLKLNKKIKKLTKKAKRHADKHDQTSSESKKNKHRKKHVATKELLEKLIKRHNTVLKRLHHHHTNYAHTLRKEHKD